MKIYYGYGVTVAENSGKKVDYCIDDGSASLIVKSLKRVSSEFYWYDVKENQVAALREKREKLTQQRTFPSQEIQTVQNIGYCKLREN